MVGYKVCLMGASFETGNRGVSALAASLMKNILKINPDADISFLIGNKAPKIINIDISGRKARARIINYRLSPRSKIQEHLLWILLLAILQRIIPFKFIRNRLVQSNAWLSALQEADLVGNIHGGDSFSDIYGVRRFIVYILDDIVALLMNKKLILFPQTYGPYNHFISRFIASFIMKHSYKIYTRDLQSIAVVNELVGSKSDRNYTIFCPDVAFTLDSIKVDLARIKPPFICGNDIPLVGLNVNGLMYNGGYNKQNMFELRCEYRLFLVGLVKKFLEDTDVHILLIPHTFGPAGNINSDPDACCDLMGYFNGLYKDRIHISTDEYNQSEIKGLIGHCDFFIGSRMHACIAGLSQEIPTVGVAYSRKFQGIFDSVGVGEMVVDGRTFDTHESVDHVFGCFQKKDEIKRRLQKRIIFAKEQVAKVFGEILSDNP